MTRVVIVSGPAGTGKSTICKALSEELGWKCVTGSDLFKDLLGVQDEEENWFQESRVKEEILKARLQNHEWDKLVDAKMMEYAKQGSVVLNSRTLPWLVDFGFKAWITAPVETRAKRIAKLQGIPERHVPGMIESMQRRDQADEELYKELYGFELKPDETVFDLILDTEGLTVQESIERVKKEVNAYLKGKK